MTNSPFYKKELQMKPYDLFLRTCAYLSKYSVYIYVCYNNIWGASKKCVETQCLNSFHSLLFMHPIYLCIYTTYYELVSGR